MQLVAVVLAGTWATGACAQFLYSVAGDLGQNTLTSLCNKSFSSANATGLFQVQPHVAQLPQDDQPNNDSGYTLPVGLGVSVVETSRNLSGTVEWSIWLNTNGANYSNDFGLGYDVCFFTISQISDNTLLRGQTDTGNCLATLDSECVSAIEDAATGYALGLINNATPSPNSNLTADSLSRICYDIANSIQSEFPKQCTKYMNPGRETGVDYMLTSGEDTIAVTGAGLTSNDHAGIYDGCTLTDSKNGDDYYFLFTVSGQTHNDPTWARQLYSGFNWAVVPTMLTFMPIANINAAQSIAEASSKMSCIHATHVNPGSENPITAPSPTAVGSGNNLSGGAIAGVVVGLVVGIAVIAGIAFWFWRRRRSPQKTKTIDQPPDNPPAYAEAKEQQTPVAEAPTESPVKELSPYNEIRPELSSQKSGPRVELAADAKPPLQRGNTGDPAELLAEVPNSASPSSAR